MILQGWHLNDDGSPRANKTVFYKAASDSEPNPNPTEPTTTVTNISGRWQLTVPDGTQWDVYLVDGPTMRIWKAHTNPPMAFGDAQIGVAANIALTKLAAGVLDETVVPDNVAANLQERLSDVVAQIKRITGIGALGGNWWTAPETNLHLVNNHIGGTGGAPSIHGLSTQASFIGESQGGGGYHFKWGAGTTGVETAYPSTPPFYYASAPIAFNAPFPSGPPPVLVVTALRNGVWAAVAQSSITASGATIYLNSPLPAIVGAEPFCWMALGH